MIDHIENAATPNGTRLAIGDSIVNNATGKQYKVDSLRRLHWASRFGEESTMIQVVLRRENGATKLHPREFAVYGDRGAYAMAVLLKSGDHVPAHVVEDSLCKGRPCHMGFDLFSTAGSPEEATAAWHARKGIQQAA